MEPYYRDEKAGIVIYHGDCREVLPKLAPVTKVLTDPPYGITANKWDRLVDLAEWWPMIRRVCSGPVVATASQPFTSMLVASNYDEFRHEWIWRKNRGSNFANTVREPMKEHESVLVFAKQKWTYNAQRETRRGSGAERADYKVSWNPGGSNYREFAPRDAVELTIDRVPSSVQEFNTETGLHPTQKPLKLFAYMILTYSNPGDLILDPFMGSGTTLYAARDAGRRAIGIESNEAYCEIAANRLAQGVLFGAE